MDWAAIEGIEILELDEIALKKGHRDYVTLVTERMKVGENRILGVLAGHEKEDVLDILRMIPLRIEESERGICCDLWEAYTEAEREVLPSARIVADRFHVARHYQDAADEVQKYEQHRLKKELSKAEYENSTAAIGPIEHLP